MFLPAQHYLLGLCYLSHRITQLLQLCYFGAVAAASHAVPSLRESGQFLQNFAGCTCGTVCRSRGIAIELLVRYGGHWGIVFVVRPWSARMIFDRGKVWCVVSGSILRVLPSVFLRVQETLRTACSRHSRHSEVWRLRCGKQLSGTKCRQGGPGTIGMSRIRLDVLWLRWGGLLSTFKPSKLRIWAFDGDRWSRITFCSFAALPLTGGQI